MCNEGKQPPKASPTAAGPTDEPPVSPAPAAGAEDADRSRAPAPSDTPPDPDRRQGRERRQVADRRQTDAAPEPRDPADRSATGDPAAVAAATVIEAQTGVPPAIPPEPTLDEIYPRDGAISWLGLTAAVLSIQFLAGNVGLLSLERPLVFEIALIATLSAGGAAARWLTGTITRRLDWNFGAVVLWFFPLCALSITQVVMLLLVAGIPSIWGRAFWSELLNTNSKTVTVLFGNHFTGYGLALILAILGGAWRYLILSLSRIDLDPVVWIATAPQRRAARLRANRINRWALVTIFAVMTVAGVGILFVRPEVILYYRGEIQLMTHRNPEVALRTFQHLVNRFPDYRYRDTVEFRAAWVLDRRLGQATASAEAYRAFLARHGYANVWSDDAAANLVSVELDQLDNATAAAHAAREYLTRFPDGHFWPHVALYEVRALLRLGDTVQATARLGEASRRFGDALIPIYNREDDFVARVPFDLAAAGALLPARR